MSYGALSPELQILLKELSKDISDPADIQKKLDPIIYQAAKEVKSIKFIEDHRTKHAIDNLIIYGFEELMEICGLSKQLEMITFEAEVNRRIVANELDILLESVEPSTCESDLKNAMEIDFIKDILQKQKGILSDWVSLKEFEALSPIVQDVYRKNLKQGLVMVPIVESGQVLKYCTAVFPRGIPKLTTGKSKE